MPLPSTRAALLHASATPWHRARSRCVAARPGSRGALTLVGLAAACAATAAEPQITFEKLLDDMTNLAALAEYPDPPYACRQFSSYDRRSITPDDHDGWFANADVDQYLRVEEHAGRKEWVMMDADGPGAIVRIWSANPKGTLRIYLDGADEPVLEAPMADLLEGRFPGIPAPIAHKVSAGWNCYLPIPYARHCTVTSDADGFYYQVNYRTYPAGTSVATFQRGLTDQHRGQIEEVNTALLEPASSQDPPGVAGVPELQEKTLAPGEGMVLMADRENAAIAVFVVGVTADNDEALFRKSLVTMTFDGETTVAVPLGDFFAHAHDGHALKSLPLRVEPRREDLAETSDRVLLCSLWEMPFRRTARIGITNGSDADCTLLAGTALRPHTWTDRSMYFHAAWHAQFDVPTRPMIDWNYVTIRGQGVYVGSAFSIANPVRTWWGEGDEKIFVDGETFPSHFGTGTEDYYGYAWCWPEPFAHAYHNQTRCDGPGNYGITCVNRWHISDRIPFERELRFDMELWHWVANITLPALRVTTYWYGRPGATANYGAPPADDLRVITMPPYVAPRVAGAIEGEEMRVLASTGKIEPQLIESCSNDHHLWWRAGKLGERLELGFTVRQAGRYRVLGRFLRAPDYAIVRVAINEQPAGAPLDLYDARVRRADELALGVFDLVAGENRIALEIVGANPKAKLGYMCGLDYLRPELPAPGEEK